MKRIVNVFLDNLVSLALNILAVLGLSLLSFFQLSAYKESLVFFLASAALISIISIFILASKRLTDVQLNTRMRLYGYLLVFTVLAVITFRMTFTFSYKESRHIKGVNLSDAAAKYIQEFGGKSPVELFTKFRGNADKIWTDLWLFRGLLWLTFIAVSTLTSLFVYCVVKNNERWFKKIIADNPEPIQTESNDTRG